MSILYAFEGIRKPALTAIAFIFSTLGEDFFFLCVLGVIFWCVNKRVAYKLTISYIILGGLTDILRNTFHIERPWITDPSFRPSGLAKTITTGYALPSSHAINVSFLATGFFVNSRRFLTRAIPVALAVLCIVSRLYLGTETLLNSVIAIPLAIVICFTANRIINNTIFDPRKQFNRALLLLIPSFVVTFVGLSFYFYDVIDQENLTITLGNAGLWIGFIVSWFIETNFINFNVRCPHRWMQFVKAIIGIAIILFFKVGLSTVLSLFKNGFFFSEFISNLLAALCAFAIYPLIIRKLFSSRYN